MTLQLVRAYYERVAAETAAEYGIQLRYDNQLVADGDAADEFMTTRLNFGLMTEPTTCGSIENIRGSLIVEHYSPKGIGPGRGQDVLTRVMQRMHLLTKRPVQRQAGVLGTLLGENGPAFTALSDRPYFLSAVSSGIVASFTSGTGPMPPLPPLPPLVFEVDSLYTRTGDVVAEEGDYTVDQLSDVDLISNPIEPDDILKWSGTHWIGSPNLDAEEY